MSDPVDWDALRKAARDARKQSYSPYSHFAVGAAVQAGGAVFRGCNVENSSYPVGVCAERAAVAAAIAAGQRDLQAVVIAAERPVAPCGMCRQALAEFNETLPILLVGEDNETRTSLDRLLPDPFTAVS